jgi:hypothetical protein
MRDKNMIKSELKIILENIACNARMSSGAYSDGMKEYDRKMTEYAMKLIDEMEDNVINRMKGEV